MADPSDFEVDRDELADIFTTAIRDLVFENAVPYPPGQRPVMVQLGGQLAAGKSTAMADIQARHGVHVVELKPDTFRPFHPQYARIVRDHPHEAVALTNQAMHTWCDMVRDYAHQHGYGLIVEGTFSRPEYLVAYAEQMAQPATRDVGGVVEPVHDGFINEVVVVATPYERSALDMVGRYVGQPPGKGRWADIGGHDFSFHQLPDSVETLETTPQVDRIIITDRSGALRYQNQRGADGAWQEPPQAAQALRDARSEGHLPFDAKQAQAWLESYWKYSTELLDRGELNASTAPTMLSLHSTADQLAAVAYAGDAHQLSEHARWQSVQKVVFMAADRGTPNADLPHHPQDLLEADATQKARYLAAMKAPSKTGSGAATDAEEAVKRATKGMAPPTIGPSTSSGTAIPTSRHHGRDKGSDIER
ncbi:zeta toxin family protein [Nocardiopsis dassonvillei]|uniref:zeta toxin family protein n=1 Tax=Nocardiopsis dassonvillei TaxID=2014 RepID=UPI003672CD9C